MLISQKWATYYYNPDSESFKSSVKISRGNHISGATSDVKIAVPLKYLRNFERNLEKSWIDCRIHLILTWFADCAISLATPEQDLQ